MPPNRPQKPPTPQEVARMAANGRFPRFSEVAAAERKTLAQNFDCCQFRKMKEIGRFSPICALLRVPAALWACWGPFLAPRREKEPSAAPRASPPRGLLSPLVALYTTPPSPRSRA